MQTTPSSAAEYIKGLDLHCPSAAELMKRKVDEHLNVYELNENIFKSNKYTHSFTWEEFFRCKK